VITGDTESAGINRIGVGMRESYKEDLPNHFSLELYADGGNGMGVATTKVYAVKLLSSEIKRFECRQCCVCGQPIRSFALLAATLHNPAD
jgi:hypothetical protein